MNYKSGMMNVLLLVGSAAQAEISTNNDQLLINNGLYDISQDLGQTVGSNLFHTFDTFNLNQNEIAQFSGADSIQNIISRVTGGEPSFINGTIRSTIPNADFYFLNPYGIMFGPNAQLEVQGSFYASTADYLRLGKNGRFDARNPSDSLLTVAPIESFGFLTDSPAKITTQNSQLLVPRDKTLSLIAGHLQFQGTQPIQFDDSNTYATFATSLLHTAGGQINLAAMGSAGEVLLNDDLTMTGRGGDITLNRTLIDTSGLGSGNLKIRGGRLQMHDSTLQANTLGELDGGLMDIQLTESLQVDSEPYYFNAFSSRALGLGKGGSIAIKVPEFTASRIILATSTLGAVAGDMDIAVMQLNLLEGAGITSGSAGLAKSGDITINATESILISGRSIGSYLVNNYMLTDLPSFIDSTSYTVEGDSLGGGTIDLTTGQLDMVGGFITSTSLGTGNAGNIVIHADNVNLIQGGMISTVAHRSGLAGNIRLAVKDTLFLSGRLDFTFVTPSTGVRFENNQSNISSFSLSGSGGQIDLSAKTIHLTKEAAISASSMGLSEKASSMTLRADNIILTESAQINSSNRFYAGSEFLLGDGQGHGGDIHIQTKQLTLDGENQKPSLQQLTGISSDTYSQGQGGNLFIEAESLDISHGAAISARSFDTGDAGQINLQAQHLHLAKHGSISTAATQAGGGNIVLSGLSGLVYLDHGEITTSVATGQGSGGNITIETPRFVVLNQGQIIAQADAGHGGNIRIVAKQFITSSESLVSASSRLGLDGNVEITSPDATISSGLLNLSKVFIKKLQIRDICKEAIAGQLPTEFQLPLTFKVNMYRFPNDFIGDWIPSNIYRRPVCN